MNCVEFFASPELELPTQWPQQYFIDSFREIVRRYEMQLPKVDATDDLSNLLKQNVGATEKLRCRLEESVEQYLLGKVAASYTTFSTAMNEVQPWIEKLYSLTITDRNFPCLYRVRSSAESKLELGDLFHIPFDQRHLVRTQRYGIPGMPSLYLGGSLWICWEEMGKPPFSSLHVAQFNVNAADKIRVLNLAYRPWHIAAAIDNDRSWLNEGEKCRLAASMGILWPLFAACSIQVKHRPATFSPEYLVPQHLLRWVVDNDLDGIRYFSTKVTTYPSNPNAGANYVFPARTSQNSGFCDVLKKKFTMTDPLPWQVLHFFSLDTSPSHNRELILDLTSEISLRYWQTPFYSIEEKLAYLRQETP